MVFLVLLVGATAQNDIVSSFERVNNVEDLTLKLSFHSWGEDRTTSINLDQYFPVKRDPNSRYVYLAPPEISVSIDQSTGVATLKAFSQWTGTRDILFSLTDVYNLEKATSNLQNYRELISKQRAPARVKQEFEDLPAYHLLEKILDDLESKETTPPKIEVEKSGNNIKINVAETIGLEVDLKTLTEENIKTLKPKISISINPDESTSKEEVSEGLSFFIFLPLYLILATLAIIGGVYVRKHRDKFARVLKKEKSKEKSGAEKLNLISKELSSISNNLDNKKIEESVDAVYEEIKKFFNVLTTQDYDYSYAEIEEAKLEKKLSPSLKRKLIGFSSEISDIRFKGETIEKQDIRKIIDKTKKLIKDSFGEEETIEYSEEKDKLKKTFLIKTVNYVVESFKSKRPNLERKSVKIKEEVKPSELWKGILHKFGVLKTLAQKEFEKKREYQSKLEAIKEKQKVIEERKKQKELEKERKKEEKRRKKLLKLKEKQRAERLKLLEIQRRLEEKQKAKEERVKRRKERIRKVRDYLHDRFGLFRTVRDLEKEIETKRKIEADKKREYLSKKKRRKQAFLNLLHFFRLYKTPEEKSIEERILEKEARLEKERKNRKQQERKRKFLSILHSLKLYRTPQDVKDEENRRLAVLRQKERSKEEKFKQELENQKEKQKQIHLEKQRKLAEKHRKQRLKEIQRKIREEIRERRRKAFKKFLHDKLGIRKTPSEIKNIKESDYRKQLEKRNKSIERRKNIKHLLHDYFGLYKSHSVIEREIEISKKKKIEQDIEIKKKKLQKELQRKKDIQEKNERKAGRKANLKKFLHDNFGLYRTQQELENQKEKLRLKLRQERENKFKKSQKSFERRQKLRNFLHKSLGLFKTREEIESSKLERKKHRIEWEHKLEDSIIRAIESRVKRKKLTPEQEIQILMQLEREAIVKNKYDEAEHIKKKINKLYKSVRREKRRRTPLMIYKIANSLEGFRDYLFSKSSRLEGVSPFMFRISKSLQNSISPKLENSRIEQITYLVSKAEIELKRKKQDEAKEIYQRAVSLYKSMNHVSKSKALPELLMIKNEITSIALQSSLDKAFKSMYLGQTEKAEKIYENINVNFANLPKSEREKMYEKKEELYEKLKHKSAKEKTKISFNIFKKKDERKFFPIREEKFMPREIKPQVNKQVTHVDKHQKRESMINYLLAKRPKFPSIKTEIGVHNHNQKNTEKLLSHVSKAELHIQNKDHKKAHEHFQSAISLFKDTDLKPEIRDKIYYDLNKIKAKILHTSLSNFIEKTKESLTKNKHEEARKFHETASKIYTSLHGNKKLPEITSTNTLEKEILEAISILKRGNVKEANNRYIRLNEQYNNLKLEEKKKVYPKIVSLYSELLKIGKD